MGFVQPPVGNSVLLHCTCWLTDVSFNHIAWIKSSSLSSRSILLGQSYLLTIPFSPFYCFSSPVCWNLLGEFFFHFFKIPFFARKCKDYVCLHVRTPEHYFSKIWRILGKFHPTLQSKVRVRLAAVFTFARYIVAFSHSWILYKIFQGNFLLCIFFVEKIFKLNFWAFTCLELDVIWENF